MKNPAYQILSHTFATLFGFFLALFVISFVMSGIAAFILAILGGITSSLFLRLAKFRLKSFLPGLILGHVICLGVLVWLGEHWELSVNLWASTIYVLVLGLTRVFLSDDLLIKWLGHRFPKTENSVKHLQ
ncbi:MAG: hypothetical protein ACOYZ6_05550 [Chloroflexota bacterium]